MTAHTCPYAAALSDDETSQSSSQHRSIRSKCPAFANACPFRDAASDPEKLRDIMKTVPTSHFETTIPFQQAMEHIHNVSSWLGSRGTDAGRNTAVEPFMIRGGCPFQSFHKSHHASSSEKPLAMAMEEYSLAAIMGQLGGRLTEKEGREEEEGEPEEERQWKQEVSDTVGPLYPDKSAEPRREEEEKEIQPSISSSVSTLSQALKSGTAESHTAAENVHFVKNFIKGIIDRELYMELVTGLYHTYVTLEKLLDQHAPTYFPSLHFPQELNRAEALHEDMEFWHGIHWRNKCNPSPAVKDYIDRMEEVGRMDPLLLLSHAYTRYLGDLSGGKVLSRIARRALHLDGYNGLQFYQFESISSYKVFKDQYRSALDELALKPDEVGRLVAEANVAFALNMRVFEELDVSGGVPGARVRDVREALIYYDREMEEQKFKNDVINGTGEEAKCPFGFTGGPNPHESNPVKKGTQVMDRKVETKGRCPWPFVVFHDPVTFMKDWQTWCVIGLTLCWLWDKVQ